jgi:hypothetical protein
VQTHSEDVGLSLDTGAGGRVRALRDLGHHAVRGLWAIMRSRGRDATTEPKEGGCRPGLLPTISLRFLP